MAVITDFGKLNEENLTRLLQELGNRLNGDKADIVLDCSSLRRLDSNALRALEEFVSKAEAKAIKVVLRGVNVDIYKVLTLVKLTSRFSFVN